MVVQKNTITVTGLKSLYSKWSTLKPYLPAMPPEDITLDIPYLRVQSKPGDGTKKCLRIVAFHGTPANADQYEALAEALAEICNVDFIVPTFPDLKFTLENRIFWQSTEERLALMEVFLEALGVQDVDIAVGHSTGGYAALKLALNAGNLKSRAVCLICTNIPRFVDLIGPKWIQGNLCYLLRYQCLQPYVVSLYELIIRNFRLDKKMTAYDAMSSAFPQYATRYWKQENAPKAVREAASSGVPRMMIYGGRDYLLKLKYSQLLAHDLGNADPANHYTYEGKEEQHLKITQQPPKDSALPMVLHFTHGGHYCFQQFPKIIAKHMLEFARKSKLYDEESSPSEEKHSFARIESPAMQQRQLDTQGNSASKDVPLELQVLHSARS